MIETRLTKRFGLRHPIVQAPMAMAAGGELASAVSRAGGLGLIGGGYGDPEWLDDQFRLAGDAAVGCGLITWALEEKPQVLEQVLSHSPLAVFLSFGDPSRLAPVVSAAGLPLLCQIQTLADARRAMDVGADVIVAQGAEAGGHGESRATFTLVPEVADAIALHAPETILCAAGGVADGRGLAAAMMLGADGVVVGSRFWASDEALVHPNMLDAAVAASGDDTLRSSVMDIARELKWPARYTARVLRNAFTDRWHGDIEGLKAAAVEESAKWRAAWLDGDTRIANTFVGEVTGLLHDAQPAAAIVEKMVTQAEALVRQRVG